jgi:RNA polymerase sigma-70 factor (ECF subfamily)
MDSENALPQNQQSTARPMTEGSQVPREKRLVAAAKRSEAGAFGELCRPYIKRLLPTIQRITKDRQDAEDALQDSFLRALVHVREFDERSSFSTWLTRIAINSALMTLRKRRSSLEIPITDDGSQGSWSVIDDRLNPEECCAQRERDEILRRAVGNLRPGIRRALQLQQLQEHSTKDTASALHISVTAAKGRLFHARAELRKSALLRRIGHPKTNHPKVCLRKLKC